MLEFMYGKRKYVLNFNVFPVIQIVGESATGKSLLCSDLENHIFESKRKDAFVIDIFDLEGLDAARAFNLSEKHKYIVIDNADLIITEELQMLISDSIDARKNFWVLMGRNDFWCVDPKCVGVLRKRREAGIAVFDVVYG